MRRARHAMGRCTARCRRCCDFLARGSRGFFWRRTRRVTADALALADVSVGESDSLWGILARLSTRAGCSWPSRSSQQRRRTAADAEASALVDGLRAKRG